MNHPRKKSAVNKHFSKPYGNLDELRAGLKADEANYTDDEILEIVDAIGQKAKEASEGQEGKATPAPATLSGAASPEELAEFKAWKESQKGLSAGSTAELTAAVTKAASKPTNYKDFDVFEGNIIKDKVINPHNEERPHVVITRIELGKIVRLARIEIALAHEFNEFAIGQESNHNHGNVCTAHFYFPKGEKVIGDQVSITEWAAYQRKDMRFRAKYDPRTNISLIIAAQMATTDY